MRRVVVIVSNEKDHSRAESTLTALREVGRWCGDVVWIAIGFDPSPAVIQRLRIQVLRRPMLDMDWLWKLRQSHPFHDTDGREKHKLIQFSKWHVFDTFFLQWDSLLYLDAGMHIGRPIHAIFSVPHRGCIVAPDDRFPFNDPDKNFRKQFSNVMPDRYKELEIYCENKKQDWLDKGGYFLNCLWLMDTTIIRPSTLSDLCALTRRFPISRTNEMAIMNLYMHDLWKPLPETVNGVHLFDWTERFGRTTKDYIFLKYPHFPLQDRGADRGGSR